MLYLCSHGISVNLVVSFVTAKFPELLTIDIPDGTVLDGEIIVTDSSRKTRLRSNDVKVPIKTLH